jgi:hypothetical protein
MRVVLEGLTGTGKTHTIAALGRLGALPAVLVPEDETFGDLTDELDSGAVEPRVLVRRLMAACERLEREQLASFVLERFHPSYYALVPDWDLYGDIDRRLAALGARTVGLTLPDGRLRERSLLRHEFQGRDWQGLSQRFGSEALALAALERSQRQRLEAVGLSQLPSLTLDTDAMAWDEYAAAIVEFG